MVMQLGNILPRKAVFSLLYVSTTPTLSRGIRKLIHGPGTWFACLAGSLSEFCAYLHKNEIQWVKIWFFSLSLFLNVLFVSIL